MTLVRFTIHFEKRKTISVTFLYTKRRTIYFTLFFMKFLKLAFIYKKAWHFALRDVFIYKNPDTSQKAQQFALCFYIQNPDTLRYAIFHWIFEICGGGGHFYFQKTIHFALHFYIQQIMNFALRFIYTICDTMRYIFIFKKRCTFRYVYIYIIYLIVLVPNYKCTYDQSNQIEK